jgi:hypothetical protein
LFGEEVDNDTERKPKIGKSEPTEYERENVVLARRVNKGHIYKIIYDLPRPGYGRKTCEWGCDRTCRA